MCGAERKEAAEDEMLDGIMARWYSASGARRVRVVGSMQDNGNFREATGNDTGKRG